MAWTNFNETEGFDGKYFTAPVNGTYFFRAQMKAQYRNDDYMYMNGSAIY